MDLRPLRRLLASAAPAGVGSQINTNAFQSVWLSEYPPSEPDLTVFLYLHGLGFDLGTRSEVAGGAYVVGNARMDFPALQKLTAAMTAAGCKSGILSVEYSLAPEFPYPRALKEVVAAYDYLVQTLLIPTNRIIMAGTSAGGGLAIGALLMLRDRPPARLPAGVLLISPWLDLRMNTPAYRRFASAWLRLFRHRLVPDPGMMDDTCGSVDMLNHEALGRARDWYLQGRPVDAINSPVRAELHALPPALVLAGEVELFIDDIREFVDKYNLANGPGQCTLVTERSGMHATAVMTPFNTDRAERQLSEAARFARQVVSAAAIAC